jgi:hypothetical protein
MSSAALLRLIRDVDARDERGHDELKHDERWFRLTKERSDRRRRSSRHSSYWCPRLRPW